MRKQRRFRKFVAIKPTRAREPALDNREFRRKGSVNELARGVEQGCGSAHSLLRTHFAVSCRHTCGD
jgi:hypothetical protein